MVCTAVCTQVRTPARAVRLTPARVAGSIRVADIRRQRRSLVVVRADPDIPGAIKEAEETCEDGSAAECANAWDTVEELSAAQAHKKTAEQEKKDPLDAYCEEVPDADECRVYED